MSFIAGGVLAAGGVVLIVLPEKDDNAEKGEPQVPMEKRDARIWLAPNVGGAALGGSF